MAHHCSFDYASAVIVGGIAVSIGGSPLSSLKITGLVSNVKNVLSWSIAGGSVLVGGTALAYGIYRYTQAKKEENQYLVEQDQLRKEQDIKGKIMSTRTVIYRKPARDTFVQAQREIDGTYQPKRHKTPPSNPQATPAPQIQHPVPKGTPLVTRSKRSTCKEQCLRCSCSRRTDESN